MRPLLQQEDGETRNRPHAIGLPIPTNILRPATRNTETVKHTGNSTITGNFPVRTTAGSKAPNTAAGASKTGTNSSGNITRARTRKTTRPSGPGFGPRPTGRRRNFAATTTQLGTKNTGTTERSGVGEHGAEWTEDAGNHQIARESTTPAETTSYRSTNTTTGGNGNQSTKPDRNHDP